MKTVKKLLLFLLIGLLFLQPFATSVNAEAAVYRYTYNLSGASDYSSTDDIATDSEGNVYSGGYFEGTSLDFDPTTGTNIQSESGTYGGYVTKLGSDGSYKYSYIWTNAYVNGIEFDATNNMYIGMVFTGTNTDLDPTSGTDLKTSAGGNDGAIIKINSAGIYQWSLTFGGTGADVLSFMNFDDDYNLYFSGTFSGTNTDMDPTAGSNLKNSNGSTDAYITKLNSDFTYGYTFTIGGTSSEDPPQFAVDSDNNLFYGVAFQGSNVDVDPTSGTELKSSSGNRDFVFTKINSDGSYNYSYKFGSTGYDRIIGMAANNNGDIFVSGSFVATVDFDPTSGTDNKTSTSPGSAFLMKINSDGSYGYTHTLGGSGAVGYNLKLDLNENIYLAGYFSGSNNDFDPSSGTALKNSNGSSDIFLVKFDSAGEFLYAYTWGGSSFDAPYTQHINSNNVYLGGEIDSTSFDGDPTNGVDTITTNGNGQSFITKLIIDSLSPTIALSSTISNSSDTTPTITGTATDSESLGTITTIEFQVDSTSGSWTACTADDGAFDEASEPFTCSVPTSLTEGSHTIYVRSTDSNSNTTSSSFTSNGFKIDTTTPTSLTNVSSNGQTYEKRFQTLNIADLSSVGDNDHPQFCFSKAYDTENGSGISSYTLRVDGRDYLSGIPYTAPNVGGDVRQDGEYGIIKETEEYWYRYSNDSRVSENQEICVYGKGDTKKLHPGFHTWSIKTQDNAGNSIETETRRFLVRISSGSFLSSGAGWGENANTDYKPGFSQGEWFPASILKVGNRTFVNELSTLNPTIFNSEKPFLINTSNPTFYGIANSGSKVYLTITKEHFDEGLQRRTREQITKQETTANESSNWGITLTKDIATLLSNTSKDKPLYFVTVTVEKENKLAILYDIPVSLSTVYTSQPVLGVADKTTTKTIKKKAQIEKKETIAVRTKDTEPTPSLLTKVLDYFK